MPHPLFLVLTHLSPSTGIAQIRERVMTLLRQYSMSIDEIKGVLRGL